jgi:PPOX class probable F420-dependent enzyme
VYQRREITMSEAEIAAFIDEQRSVVMCTMHPSGSIHCVPMWYGLVDGVITVQTKAKSQKAQNLRRDPRLTFLLEAGSVYSELRGVEFVGHAELIDDPDQLWDLAVNVYSRYYGPYTEDLRAVVAEKSKKRVGIRIAVDRIVSWDHRKMATPSAAATV